LFVSISPVTIGSPQPAQVIIPMSIETGKYRDRAVDRIRATRSQASKSSGERAITANDCSETLTPSSQAWKTSGERVISVAFWLTHRKKELRLI
jgi:hypothetical protein